MFTVKRLFYLLHQTLGQLEHTKNLKSCKKREKVEKRSSTLFDSTKKPIFVKTLMFLLVLHV